MIRSLKDKVVVESCLVAQTVSANASATGVDLQDADSLMFLISAGENGGSALAVDNKIDIILQHSDVDVDGSYADCADDDIFDAEDGANGVVKALDATDDASAVYEAHYRGNKRYARVRLEETGTVSMPMSVVSVKSHLRAAPEA